MRIDSSQRTNGRRNGAEHYPACAGGMNDAEGWEPHDAALQRQRNAPAGPPRRSLFTEQYRPLLEAHKLHD